MKEKYPFCLKSIQLNFELPQRKLSGYVLNYKNAYPDGFLCNKNEKEEKEKNKKEKEKDKKYTKEFSFHVNAD